MTKSEALRQWAEGSTTMQAAVELLSTALNGRLLHGPWVRTGGSHGYWFDTLCADEESGYLSGGERRVLAVACSLMDSELPVDLSDAIPGLDPATFTAVVQALGVAYGLRPDPINN